MTGSGVAGDRGSGAGAELKPVPPRNREWRGEAAAGSTVPAGMTGRARSLLVAPPGTPEQPRPCLSPRCQGGNRAVPPLTGVSHPGAGAAIAVCPGRKRGCVWWCDVGTGSAACTGGFRVPVGQFGGCCLSPSLGRAGSDRWGGGCRGAAVPLQSPSLCGWCWPCQGCGLCSWLGAAFSEGVSWGCCVNAAWPERVGWVLYPGLG